MRMRFRDKKVNRDWLNTNCPCMMACPAGTNAGRYVALIAEGRFEEAYRYARDPNPMASVCGRVCAHPCETACRRGEIDKPIAIRALKRFLTERYGPESRHPLVIERREPAPKLGYRVAVVGSGPVGLSAAHGLAWMGYSVTIFEAAPAAGGMLRLGIPEYRLPRSVVDAQIREILETGDVTLKLNSAAGRDFTISGLRQQGFDAVVIAVGAHRSRDLSIPGVDLDGVHKGIDFLLNANLGYRFTIGKKVVVIGGGNVAMDVARSAAREVLKQHAAEGQGEIPSDSNIAAVAAHEMVDISLSALRLGAQEVSIVCLEKRNEMPAALEEIEEAETEGIILRDGRGPKQVVGRDGKVVGHETLQTKSVFDSTGRFNPVFYENSESVTECDTIIMAIGQTTKLDFLKPEDGVQVSPRGLIVADRNTLMTTSPGVFAGGDCVFGPRLIIDSVGDGRRIAAGIDEYLTGRKRPEPEIEVEVLDRHRMFADYINWNRQPVPMLPLDRRTGVTEVEIGFDPEVLDHIQQNEQLYRVELDDVAAEELGIITGSAMIKDETRCIRCGLCAERCPVQVITMEAYHVVTSGLPELIQLQTR